MKRIVDVDMETRCKSIKTALNRFFKKYPELIYWKEQFEYMAENNEEFNSDMFLADGTKTDNWAWALHLDINEDFYYICVIERA